MKANITLTALLILTGYSMNVIAQTHSDVVERAHIARGDTQSIHVVNLLANTNIPDPGMTRTPIIIKYFNGSSWPCWTYTLNYQEDYTVHAGPYTGCVNKINQVMIIPVMVADKLNTYKVPDAVTIDTTKYSSHVVITQDQGPIFDLQSGLVTMPGVMKIQIQADNG